MTCFPLRGKCRRQYVQANWIFRSVATLKSSETPFRAQRDGAYQRSSNNVGYTVVLPPQPFGELPRWGAKNVLPLNLMAFPAWGRLCFGIAVFTKYGKPVNLLTYEDPHRAPSPRSHRTRRWMERTIKKEIPFLRFPFLIQVRLRELTN